MMSSSAQIEADARRLKRNIRGWRELMSKQELAEYDRARRPAATTNSVTSDDLRIIAARFPFVRCRHCRSIERADGLTIQQLHDDLLDAGWRREGDGLACCQPARAPTLTLTTRITQKAIVLPEENTSTPGDGRHSPTLGNVSGPQNLPVSRPGPLTYESDSMRNEPAPSKVSEELPGVQQESSPGFPVEARDTRGGATEPRGMMPVDRSPAAQGSVLNQH